MVKSDQWTCSVSVSYTHSVQVRMSSLDWQPMRAGLRQSLYEWLWFRSRTTSVLLCSHYNSHHALFRQKHWNAFYMTFCWRADPELRRRRRKKATRFNQREEEESACRLSLTQRDVSTQQTSIPCSDASLYVDDMIVGVSLCRSSFIYRT